MTIIPPTVCLTSEIWVQFSLKCNQFEIDNKCKHRNVKAAGALQHTTYVMTGNQLPGETQVISASLLMKVELTLFVVNGFVCACFRVRSQCQWNPLVAGLFNDLR